MPLFYERNNIMGTLNMMEAARQNGVKRSSSMHPALLYMGITQYYLRRRTGRGNLLSPYALTKRVDEEYGKLYKRLYGLDTYGLRYFNVFGRRQDLMVHMQRLFLSLSSSFWMVKCLRSMVMANSPEISLILITLSKRI